MAKKKVKPRKTRDELFNQLTAERVKLLQLRAFANQREQQARVRMIILGNKEHAPGTVGVGLSSKMKRYQAQVVREIERQEKIGKQLALVVKQLQKLFGGG